MPLTSKGEKLRDKFRGQYGKKKGDSVFYAMENSGKLKKVIKAGGGRDASKDDFKTPSSGTYSRSYNPGAGGVVQHGGTKSVGSGTTGSSGSNNTKIRSGNIPIIGPVTLGINLVKKMFEPKSYNKSKNLSEGIVTHKKRKKPPMPPTGGDDNRPQPCPDGTMPPCKTTTPITQPTKPTSKFLGDFKTYNSGGVSSGPPPKRGPNPQVPPIKMRSGKMTKTYKMSCPHRPDGIRGMGAAIKGHKFIGVK